MRTLKIDKFTKKQWKMVVANKGLVYSMAIKCHIPIDEIEEFAADYGYPALMKSVLGFKPELGFAFSTYACHGLEFACRNWKRDKAVGRHITNCIGNVEDDDSSSFNPPARPDNHYESENTEIIDRMLNVLTTEEALAIRLRYIHGLQLAAIGDIFGVGMERARQIIYEGLTYLRETYPKEGKGAAGSAAFRSR